MRRVLPGRGSLCSLPPAPSSSSLFDTIVGIKNVLEVLIFEMTPDLKEHKVGAPSPETHPPGRQLRS